MEYILITGAGGGMGRACVRMFAEKGYTVFALDRAETEYGENVIPVTADITDASDVAKAKETVLSVTDELKAIIHFAGIYMLDSLVEISDADFERIFRANLFGAFNINKAFVPLLHTDGRVIMTTSELAPLDPLPFTGIYGISKAALDRYAYSLCMELQLSGIHVSVIRAGAVDTGMLGASTDALDAFCARTERYVCNSKRFRQIVDSVESKSIPPEMIAKKVYTVFKKRRPAFAYGINRNILLRLLNILPHRIQLFAIRKVLK